MTKIFFVKPCTLCKMSYNVPRQFVGGGGRGCWCCWHSGVVGGCSQNRESPDFRSPEVGRYVTPKIQTSVKFATLKSYIFARFRRITFQLGKFINVYKALWWIIARLFSCLCFTRRGWICDFPPMPYLYVELFYIGMPLGMPLVQAGGQAYGHVTTKIWRIHGCIGYQIFLPIVLRCTR